MANAPINTGNGWMIITNRDPTSLDSDYSTNFFWLNTDDESLWVAVDLSPDDATWKQIQYSLL